MINPIRVFGARYRLTSGLYSTLNGVMTMAVAAGYNGSKITLKRRLDKGERRLEELCKPVRYTPPPGD